MPSSKRSKSSDRRQRHLPLADDLAATGPLHTKPKKRKVRLEDEDNIDSQFTDSRSSRKILKIGQDLQDEERDEEKAALPNPAFGFESRFDGDIKSDSEESIERQGFDDDDENWGSDRDEPVKDTEVDPKEMDLFDKFNPSNAHHSILQSTKNNQDDSGGGTNLTNLILEKIAAHEASQEPQPTILGGGPPEDAIELPPKVVEVYTKCAHLLFHSSSLRHLRYT